MLHVIITPWRSRFLGLCNVWDNNVWFYKSPGAVLILKDFELEFKLYPNIVQSVFVLIVIFLS